MRVKFYFSIVDGIASLTLVTHRVRISHVQSSSIAHKALHLLHVGFGLVQAREGCDLHCRCKGSTGAQAESGGRSVTSVPEVVASFHDSHVDTVSSIVVTQMCKFLFKSTQ